MSLVRAWRRQLLGASTAAVLAPLTLVAALAVVGLGGGFGRLGALTQIVSGPQIPLAQTVPALPPGARPQPPQVTSAASRVPARVLTAARPAGAHAGASAPAAGSGAPSPAITSSPGGGTVPVRTPGSAGHHPVPPAPPAPKPAPAGAAKGLLSQTVSAATKVTNKLGGPVGTVGTTTLEAAQKLLDPILPPGLKTQRITQ